MIGGVNPQQAGQHFDAAVAFHPQKSVPDTTDAAGSSDS
jgi:hypothetical protein